MNLKEIIFELLDIIPELWDHPDIKTEVLIGSGYVPVKSRDEREPMRMEKIRMERKLRLLMAKRFKRQLEMLRYTGIQKAKPKITLTLPDWEEDDFFEELLTIIFGAAKFGVELFADQVSVGIDYTLANAHALAFARKYTFDLIKGIDETTVDILQNAVSAFIDTPGFTIGDIMEQLTEFSEKRAASIAVTETTRAFAEGQKEAGRLMREAHPDLKIEKTWFTNNDDRVCDICGPLDGKSIDYDDEFPEDGPPAHVNCRCWIEYNTRING